VIDADLSARLELALAAARESAGLVLDRFRSATLAVERKPDGSPVTEVDRAVEAYLRRRIGAAFPADGIVGEEHGERSGTSGASWILDPIDGTVAFVQGVPLFGTLIALEREGRSLLGVIALPALGEIVYGAAGHGAWMTGPGTGTTPRAARVSECASLAKGLVCFTSVGGFEAAGRRAVLDALRNAARDDRGWGDCYGYALVATGRAEVMLDPSMSLWDVAALAPILEEAGGTLTDWQGRATIHAGEAIATNGHLRDTVLGIVGRHDPDPDRDRTT
jgi:histidinol phosphatase-like enzyme (inositol monophosphatase family)